MTSPISPTTCQNTGRVLTEWYEAEELDDDQVKSKVIAEMGLDPNDLPWAGTMLMQMPPEMEEVFREYTSKVTKFKRRKFRHGMSDTEVAARLNEATKLVDPDNYKFLPDDVRARTGLEINPLWAMEVLVRSGALPLKDQLSALKELAAYTHSKAPSLQHNTNVNLKPEDWLLEIAKDEYSVVDVARPERIQPLQKREKGEGKDYERRRIQKDAGRQALIEKQASAMDAIMAELGDYDVEEGIQEFDE
jgi:hypothetical protein